MHSDVLELVKWGNILATILPLFHSYSGPRHYNLPLGSLLWPPTRCSTSACAPWVYSWHNCRMILFKCSQIMSFLCWKSPVTFHCAQSSSLKDLMWSVRPSLLSVSQPDDSYCSPPGSLAPASLLLHIPCFSTLSPTLSQGVSFQNANLITSLPCLNPSMSSHCPHDKNHKA